MGSSSIARAPRDNPSVPPDPAQQLRGEPVRERHPYEVQAGHARHDAARCIPQTMLVERQAGDPVEAGAVSGRPDHDRGRATTAPVRARENPRFPAIKFYF
ncbi:hypothetical protein GCM10022239_14030 [Leifsonia bigeumensis]|uniref:Uncharacterized protein n=1 Tax=Leifsonella bigeumensis TaxID=433643 RepID=A0ABP7FJ75_9MICO